MTRLPFLDPDDHGALSGGALEHALQVLADATLATVVLFDNDLAPAVGPIPGNTFARLLLASPAGREAVIALHRQAAGNVPGGSPAPSCAARLPLERLAVPVLRGGRRHGTLTLGDRAREPLDPELVRQLAEELGLEPQALHRAARELPPWDAAEASAARNMGALLVELMSDLCVQDEDLRRRIEELTTVYSVAGMFAGRLDLQQILDKTAAMVCDVLKVRACSIRLIDEASGLLTIKAVHNLSPRYLDKGPVPVEKNPIDQEAMGGRVVYIADLPSDPRTLYPQEAREEGIASALVCGLIYRGRAVGAIRVYSGEPRRFSSWEQALLQAVASQAAAAIVNARLVGEKLEAERYARQIAYAGDVQRRMIPAAPPQLEHIEIGCVYRPTYDVGGDFYDLINLPKGNLGVAIADVSGKGVPASLMMASLRSALRVYAYFTYDVDRIMGEVNRYLCRDTRPTEFATLFYGVITPDARRLTYCSAGHEPPLLLRDGQITTLDAGGIVLGVDCLATYERGLQELRPGDIVLLFTDGAIDATSFSDEHFGRQRLIESLKRHAGLSAQRMAQNIDWDIRRFEGLADRTDDVSLVVLKIR